MARHAHLAALVVLGCRPVPGGDVGGKATGDTGDSGDSGDSGQQALLTFQGAATVDGSGYAGTEDVVLRANLGLGEELCRVHYAIASTSERTDCDGCAWAFEVGLGAPEVVLDTGACASAGYGAAGGAAIEGSTRGQGFSEEYVGHSDVLMVDQGDGWMAVSFSQYDAKTGAFVYQWDQGYLR